MIKLKQLFCKHIWKPEIIKKATVKGYILDEDSRDIIGNLKEVHKYEKKCIFCGKIKLMGFDFISTKKDESRFGFSLNKRIINLEGKPIDIVLWD